MEGNAKFAVDLILSLNGLPDWVNDGRKLKSVKPVQKLKIVVKLVYWTWNMVRIDNYADVLTASLNRNSY